jgi:hypothetical protein
LAAFLAFGVLDESHAAQVQAPSPISVATQAVAPGLVTQSKGVVGAMTDFLHQLQDGREDVQRQAFTTGVIYASIRIVLIVLATTAAFGKNFAGTRLKLMLKWLPLLSVVLAIGTGLDTFLRLGERSKGHYNYVSNVEDLETRLKSMLAAGPVTAQQLQDLEEKYSVIKAQHRRETTY